MMKVLRNMHLGALIVMLLIVAMLLPARSGLAEGEPVFNGQTKQLTVTLYPQTAVTSSGTVYSASPRTTVAGRDDSSVNGWTQADVFIKTDIATSGTLTATVQFSPNGSDWATADYEWGDSDGLNTQIHRRVMTADGVEVIRLPVAGEKLRVMLQHSATMTPTVWV
ncbi:MAG: hypothetical protein AB7V39_21000, partial [Nitrospiraceae bacterium]